MTRADTPVVVGQSHLVGGERCLAPTTAGDRCSNPPEKDEDYCVSHHQAGWPTRREGSVFQASGEAETAEQMFELKKARKRGKK